MTKVDWLVGWGTLMVTMRNPFGRRRRWFMGWELLSFLLLFIFISQSYIHLYLRLLSYYVWP